MDGTMSLADFSNESKVFLAISEELNDNWELVKKSDDQCYLVFRQKVNVLNQILNFEYHVAYSVSYQVPILFFKISRNDGTIISLDDAWAILKGSPGFHATCTDSDNPPDMYKILTQMEHPQLFLPFLALHPCRTAELLAINPNNKNRILTFISTMGPFLYLNLNEMYGKYCL